jgi:phage-related protein
VSNVGYATLSIIPSAKGFGSALNGQVSGPMTAAGLSGGRAFGGGLGGSLKAAVLPLAAVFGTAAIVKWGKAQIDALARIEVINTQTASAIKATGGAANVSATHVEDLATSLENLTGTEAESIQEGSNLLLTFKNIKNEAGAGNDIFDQSTKIMVDMARAMGTDAKGGAIQLGKALNDPVAGISALTRVGVTFSDSQKAMIQSLVDAGDVMGAQKIILAELNSEFGGAGAAYATTYAGKVDLMKHAWGTFGETIFQSVTPALGAVAGGLTNLLNNHLTPGITAMQTGFGIIRSAFSGEAPTASLGAWTGPLVAFGKSARGVFDSIVAAVAPYMPQIVASFSGLIGPLMQVVGALSPASLIFKALLPILPQLAGLVASLVAQLGPALGTVLKALAPVLDAVVSVLSGVFAAVLPALTQLIGTLAGALGPIAAVIANVLAAIMPLVTTLLNALAPVLTQLITAILPPVVQIFGFIVDAIAPLITMLADLLIPIIEALLPVVTTVFGIVADVISAVMKVVQGVIDVVLGLISGNWDQVWNGLVEIFSGIWDLIVSIVTGAVDLVASLIGAALDIVGGLWSGAWNGITSFLSDAWTNITTAIGNGINNAIEFVKALPGRALAALGVVGKILFDAGKNLIQGLIDGISAVASKIGEAIMGPIKAAVDAVKNFLGIHSPSRLFMEIGGHTAEGMALGLERSAYRVADASAALIPAVPSVSSPTIDGGGVVGALASANARSGDSWTVEYNDHSTSNEDKKAKLQKAAEVLDQTTAARRGR